VRGIFEKVPGQVFGDSIRGWSGRYRREKVGAYGLASSFWTTPRRGCQGKKLPETLRRKFVPFSEIAEVRRLFSRTQTSWRDDESRMKLLVEWWGGGRLNRSPHPTWNSNSPVRREKKWKPSTFNHHRALAMLVFREASAGKVTSICTDVRHGARIIPRALPGPIQTVATDIDYLKPLKTEEERLRAVVQRDYPAPCRVRTGRLHRPANGQHVRPDLGR